MRKLQPRRLIVRNVRNRPGRNVAGVAVLGRSSLGAIGDEARLGRRRVSAKRKPETVVSEGAADIPVKATGFPVPACGLPLQGGGTLNLSVLLAAFRSNGGRLNGECSVMKPKWRSRSGQLELFTVELGCKTRALASGSAAGAGSPRSRHRIKDATVGEKNEVKSSMKKSLPGDRRKAKASTLHGSPFDLSRDVLGDPIREPWAGSRKGLEGKLVPLV